ncbi:MAG TPA: ATP-dependent 6-phosphofructokinase [Candidatus Limnocylindrales bacterium]|nr:ATP-dependent 6-phosphofructokinase [Candidatus Limnocylindrales bacterium]
MRTLGICTGGGDCPGLNAVIRAVVKSAIVQHGWRVLGIRDSFDGLLAPEKTRELRLDDVAGLLSRGGTILGTTNRNNPLRYPTQEGSQKVRDMSDQCIVNARTLGLDAMVVAGGDGTAAIALELYRKGLPVLFVPKTIDNDLQETEMSVGFDTALHTASEALDKIHTSAESHHRVMMVELMGRTAGWIALEAGMAAGADVILIPEIPFRLQNVCRAIQQRESSGKNFTIIAMAEGIALPADLAAEHDPHDGRTGEIMRTAIARQTGKETRLTVLGHIQRGGAPSPYDRLLATRFGVKAVELASKGAFGQMVCLREGLIQSSALENAVRGPRLVNPNGEMVRAARAMGTCFGD